MNEKLKIGDVVRLKSGGPAMTVCGKADSQGVWEGLWMCKWFPPEPSSPWNDQCGFFHKDALMKVK